MRLKKKKIEAVYVEEAGELDEIAVTLLLEDQHPLPVHRLPVPEWGALPAVPPLGPGATFLVPLTRFPGFVWLIAAGFALPVTRLAAARPGEVRAS